MYSGLISTAIGTLLTHYVVSCCSSGVDRGGALGARAPPLCLTL